MTGIIGSRGGLQPGPSTSKKDHAFFIWKKWLRSFRKDVQTEEKTHWTHQCCASASLWCDPDPTCNFDADPEPDPACHFDADPGPDPAFYFDAEPDLDPSFQQKKFSNRLIFHTFCFVVSKLMRIRIRIQLMTLMCIRIRILPFNLMRIWIHNSGTHYSSVLSAWSIQRSQYI